MPLACSQTPPSDTAGVRCLKPTWKSWPSWLDVFPNHTNAPRIEACTLVMHVSLQSLLHVYV